MLATPEQAAKHRKVFRPYNRGMWLLSGLSLCYITSFIFGIAVLYKELLFQIHINQGCIDFYSHDTKRYNLPYLLLADRVREVS